MYIFPSSLISPMWWHFLIIMLISQSSLPHVSLILAYINACMLCHSLLSILVVNNYVLDHAKPHHGSARPRTPDHAAQLAHGAWVSRTESAGLRRCLDFAHQASFSRARPGDGLEPCGWGTRKCNVVVVSQLGRVGAFCGSELASGRSESTVRSSASLVQSCKRQLQQHRQHQ